MKRTVVLLAAVLTAAVPSFSLSAAGVSAPPLLLVQNAQKPSDTKAAVTALSEAELEKKIEEEYDFRKKDPLLAGVLSWYTPGLGQLYAEAPLKGAAYFIIESSLFLASFLSIADINLVADSDIGLNVGINFKKDEFGEIPDNSRNIALVFLFLGIGFHVWNVVDAIDTATLLNKNLYRDIELKYTSRATYFQPLPPGQKEERGHYLYYSHRF